MVLKCSIDSENYCDYGTEPGEQVSVTRIKSFSRYVIESRKQRSLNMARRALHNPPVRIDDGRYAAIGIDQQPTIIFYGSHPAHIQVLPGRAGIAIPAVVGDVNQNVRAQVDELTYFIGKDRFIADKNPVVMTIRGKYDAALSVGH